MSEKRRVLITGASGLFARTLAEALAGAYEMSGVDISPSTAVDTLVADMTDLEAIRSAFEGKGVVVDLAAVADDDAPWDVVYKNNFP